MKTRLPARVRGAWLQSNSALAECPFGQTRLSPQLQRLQAQRVRNSGCAEVPELRVANLPYNALEPQGVRVFYVGVDLGKRQDHTAIAVVERRERYQGAHQMPQFDSAAVRHVERMPLGTPYPAVVARVGEIVGSGELAGRCCLAVDATGVGAPVVDMLRSARLGCELSAVTITGGERANQHASGWNVPKQDLIAGLQVLLEHGQLRIARDLRGARMLMRELMDVQTRSGKTGADGPGQHDDLVIALALACWKAKQKRYMNGLGRFPGM